MTDTKNTPAPASAEATTESLRDGIEQTRAGMSATLNALEAKLSPDDLRDKVRDVVHEHLTEAKTLLQDELREAKTLVRAEMDEAEGRLKKGLSEARDTVKADLRDQLEAVEAKLKTGLAEARDTVKQDLRVAVAGAKSAVRAATLGKVEDLATDLGDAMNTTRETLIETVRQNPVPALLTGVGLAWLLMNRSKSSRPASGGTYAARTYGYPDEDSIVYRSGQRRSGSGGDPLAGARHAVGKAAGAVGDAAHRAATGATRLVGDATDVAGGALHQVSEGAEAAYEGASDLVGQAATRTAAAANAIAHRAADGSAELVHRAGDAASHVAEEAWTQARRVEQSFQAGFQQNPLALGAAALAVGAVVGFSLPRTKTEDAWLGEARDEVLHRAESVVHDAAAAVGQLGDKAAGALKPKEDEGARSSSAS